MEPVVSSRQGARRGAMAIELFIGRLVYYPLEVADDHFQKADDVVPVTRGCVVKHLPHLMLDA